MKKKIIVLINMLFVMLLLCSCKNDKAYLTTGEISFLNSSEAKAAVQEIMTDAGIMIERQEVFFSHVDQYNETAGSDLPTEKMLLADAIPYDAYELQDRWTTAYPDFMGYNCRITTYGLLGDFITVENTSNIRDEHLMFDVSALQTDDSVLTHEDTIEKFKALFSIVPTSDTKDVEQQVKAVQENWREKGISFNEDVNVSMISVFFHDKWDENTNELMAGHVKMRKWLFKKI